MRAARVGPYCQGCGQHYLDGPITLRLLARQFAERFLKLEHGLLGTFVGLTRRPGTLAREFVEGRRRPYVNPLSYLFLGAAVSLLTLPLMLDGSGGMSDAMAQGAAIAESFQADRLDAMSPERRAAVDEILERTLPIYGEKLEETVRQLNAVLALVFALVLAAFFRLFFGGARYTFAESAVPALYVTGHYYLLSALAALVTLGLPGGVWTYTAAAFVIFGALAVAAALGFYGRSLATAGLATVSFVATYVVFSAVVMVAASMLALWRARPEMEAIKESVKAAHGL